MNNFRYIFEDRWAETNGYAGFEKDKEDINIFFENKIKGTISDHASVGINSKDQHIYNLCYDCNMTLWEELYEKVINVGNKSGVKLNWDEIRHCMRFTFIWMPPGGSLLPHTARKLRALSAFNIPLRGKTEISFYEHLEGHKPGAKLETHRYYNPNFLNVNRFHGIVNDTDSERLILKTHLMIVPWDKLIESYQGDNIVNVFDFTVPWQLIDKDWHNYNKTK
jgi:hypothetical protein